MPSLPSDSRRTVFREKYSSPVQSKKKEKALCETVGSYWIQTDTDEFDFL